MKHELKHCPFCGGEVGMGRLHALDVTDPQQYTVGCYRNAGPSPCPVRPKLSRWYDTEDEARNAWNTRVSQDRVDTTVAEVLPIYGSTRGQSII